MAEMCDNEQIKLFQEYLRIKTVSPNSDWGKCVFVKLFTIADDLNNIPSRTMSAVSAKTGWRNWSLDANVQSNGRKESRSRYDLAWNATVATDHSFEFAYGCRASDWKNMDSSAICSRNWQQRSSLCPWYSGHEIRWHSILDCHQMA